MDEEKEQQYRSEYEKRLQELRLLDDDFMKLVFDHDTASTGQLLQVILDDPDLTVTTSDSQVEIKSAYGKSVRLDVHAIDSTGRNLDIEVQRSQSGAVPERARLNSAMLDTMIAESGDQGYNLCDTYVIFIAETDVLKGGKAIYHIDRRIEELDYKMFDDGSHVIYVNCAYSDEETPIGKLVHDMKCTKPDDMYYSALADRVRYFKETEGGKEAVCKAFEEIKDMGHAEGVAEGEHKRSVENARAMLADGMDCRTVAKYSGLSIEEVESLAQLQPA